MTDSSANASVSAKMGLTGWLTLLFVILKLNPGGHLDSPVEDWSWWLVFSPILIGWAIVLVILVLFLLGWLGVEVWDAHSVRKRRKRRLKQIDSNRKVNAERYKNIR